MRRLFSPRIVASVLGGGGSGGAHFSSSTINQLIRRCHKPQQLSSVRSLLSCLESSNLVFSKNLITQAEQGKKQRTEDDFESVFESVFPQWIKEVYAEHSEVPHLSEVKTRLHDAIEYNLKNGKRNRAKILVNSYRLLATDKMQDLLIREACILGWCVELIQSFFLILDDIMDDSTTRRGNLCWYKMKDVGMIAINDAIMMNYVIFYLLKKYFGHQSNYVHMIDLFTDITRYTTYGQALDLLSQPPNQKIDLSKFDQERYDAIVRYKTGYYSFCLPVRLALYLAEVNDPKIHEKAEAILLKIGHLFQVQDDYLDCYGDPSFTGKIGTDIEDGKCSWLVLQALEQANPQQRNTIEQNYGLKCPDAVKEVKKIYEELKLDQIFLEYEKNTFKEICSLIEKIENNIVSKDIFYNILFLIYQRKK